MYDRTRYSIYIGRVLYISVNFQQPGQERLSHQRGFPDNTGTVMPFRIVLLAILCPAIVGYAMHRARRRTALKMCTSVRLGVCPFKHRHLDHVVLRCTSVETMTQFYVDVLGAKAEWLNRFDGALSHLRVGDSLIDLVAYDAPLTFAKQEPYAEQSTLDHIALRVDDFDEAAARAWLSAHGVRVITSGGRYGADGNGFSLYLRDPENNVVEIKQGPKH